MGNRRSREHQKRTEIEDAWRRARFSERRVDEDVDIPAIGCLRVRLSCLPSFDQGFSWDVRQLDDIWRLFRSQIVPDTRRVLGYDEMTIDSELLSNSYGQLVSLVLPIAPHHSATAGADGESRELSVFGGLYSSVQFQWWSDSPCEWRPLVDIADHLLDAFGEARPTDDSA